MPIKISLFTAIKKIIEKNKYNFYKTSLKLDIKPTKLMRETK